MPHDSGHLYQFGPFRLDTGQRTLFRGDEPVPLPPKALDTLLALIEEGGQTLDKGELMERVWPGTYVVEASLAVAISTLRKWLGTQPNGGQYIETIPRRGYRFAAAVRELPRAGADLVLEEHTRTSILIEESESANGSHPIIDP